MPEGRTESANELYSVCIYTDDFTVTNKQKCCVDGSAVILIFLAGLDSVGLNMNRDYLPKVPDLTIAIIRL